MYMQARISAGSADGVFGKTTTLSSRLAAAVVALSAIAASGSGLAAPADEDDTGARLYITHCAECHGPTGEGDGPKAATLARKPTDLTRLAANNGGTFPYMEVYRVINSGGKVIEHGTGEMPAWEEIFAREPSPMSTETAVEARILALIEYLQSIQKPTGKASGGVPEN